VISPDILLEVAAILIVGDGVRSVMKAARALEPAGVRVDRARDHDTGRRMARLRPYDLIVLDLPANDSPQPDLSLLDIRVAYPGQRVMVLSNAANSHDRAHWLRLGAADHLAKPIAVVELVARIVTHLRRSREGPSRAPRPAAAPLVLDRARHLADAGRGPVRLSETELRLLQCLLARAPGHSSREELLAKVWGFTDQPRSNVLEAGVARLRQKLGEDVIETVRGIGYRLYA
jgi:two-component system OmpR family response regulator